MLKIMTPKTTKGCFACKDGMEKPFSFTMAFQPIVDVAGSCVYAYEALVRGPKGEGAATVLSQVTPENIYAFDQHCRVAAITLAARLGLANTGASLAINFMPGAVYSPAACIKLTLETARKVGFPYRQLIFEVSEAEQVKDKAHLRNIISEYRRLGFKVALDDFGAGHSGLNLLADFPTDIIKLDMELTRNLANRPTAMTIVRSMVEMAAELRTDLVAEGVETIEEFEALEQCGINLMQGYLFARPGFEMLPEVNLPR